MFTVNVDSNGYVLSISHTANDNIELDLDKLNLKYLNAYKLVDGKLYLDEEVYNILVAEEEQREKDEEIADLESKLNRTDYIMAEMTEEFLSLSNPLTFVADVIKILADYKSRYKDVLSNRKAWRERIEELESFYVETGKEK